MPFARFKKYRIFDILQNYSFLLCDSPVNLLRGTGKTKDALPVFLPIFGFSSVTSPEWSANTEEIVEGNKQLPFKYISGWSNGTITLQQGQSIIRTDFSRWVERVQEGYEARKDFLLIHFTRKNILDYFGASAGNNQWLQMLRVPARAWYLSYCYPTRYKSGGDFDALSSDMSIGEVDLEAYEIKQYDISDLLNVLKGVLPGA